MVIVSQDKTQILNFNNVQNARIEPYGTHIKGKKIYKIFAGNFEGYATELGTYETEEWAKEVLQEIIENYEYTKHKWAFENFRMFKSQDKDFVYEMPKE